MYNNWIEIIVWFIFTMNLNHIMLTEVMQSMAGESEDSSEDSLISLTSTTSLSSSEDMLTIEQYS